MIVYSQFPIEVLQYIGAPVSSCFLTGKLQYDPAAYVYEAPDWSFTWGTPLCTAILTGKFYQTSRTVVTFDASATNGSVKAYVDGIEVALPYSCYTYTNIKVECTPDTDYHFDKWSDGSTDNPHTFTILADTTLTTACYKEYTLDATAENGSLVAKKVLTGEVVTLPYVTRVKDEQISVEVVPDPHFHFKKWSDEDLTNPRVFTLSDDITISTECLENFHVVAVPVGDGQIKAKVTLKDGTIIEDAPLPYEAPDEETKVVLTATKTSGDFDRWINPDGTIYSRSQSITFNPVSDNIELKAVFKAVWLTLTANAASTVYLKAGTTARDVEYSLDEGGIWETLPTVAASAVALAAGDKMNLRCNTSGQPFQAGLGDYNTFSIDGDVTVSGSAMSLIDENAILTTIPGDYCFRELFKGCSGITSITSFTNAVNLNGKKYVYASMFNGCANLTSVSSNVLDSASVLSESCYDNLFSYCDQLTSSPLLSATTLAKGCYKDMFYGDIALTTAPALPVLELKEDCYRSMFQGCKALTTAPALPALTLATTCYYKMFFGCIALTSAPELKAETLANGCYQGMFTNCSALNEITCKAKDITASDCTTEWLKNVSATGTFHGHSTADWDLGENGIPSTWVADLDDCLLFTFADTTKSIYATLIPENKVDVSYTGAFGDTSVPGSSIKNWDGTDFAATSGRIYLRGKVGASSIAGITSDATKVSGPLMSLVDYDNYTTVALSDKQFCEYLSGSDEITGLFKNSTSLTNIADLTFPTISEMKSYAYAGMFENCSALTTVPTLPATTLAEGCYRKMFKSCKAITTTPELPATILAPSCYQEMFQTCWGITSAPALPATTLEPSCYKSMFRACKELTASPLLPATTLAESCYEGMFYNNVKLTSVPELPATTLAKSCYKGMFEVCSIIEEASLPAPLLVESCYQEMFKYCSALKKITCSATNVTDAPANALTNWCLWDDVSTHTGDLYGVTAGYAVDSPSGCPKYWTLHIPFSLSYPSAGQSFQYASGSGIQVSEDNITWTDLAPATPYLVTGKLLYVRGKSSTTPLKNFAGAFTSVAGNLSDLVDYEDPTASMCDYQFWKLFSDDTSLVDASALTLPSTVTAGCYDQAFAGCSALTAAPKLPATTLADNCYDTMFLGCASLVNAPELPATTLAGGCYHDMFYNCTSMVKAPVLNATDVPSGAYSEMFFGCSHLNEVHSAATTLGLGATEDWLRGVAATGDLYGTAIYTIDSPSGVPVGWTLHCPLVLMFPAGSNNFKISYGANLEYSEDYSTWNAISIGTSYSVTGDKVFLRGKSGAVEVAGITGTYTSASGPLVNLVDHENFSTEIAENQFCSNNTGLFDGNTQLVDASGLIFPTKSNHYAYRNMFYGCTALTAAPTITVPQLYDGIFQKMFYNCSALTTIPSFPSTMTAKAQCFNGMFSGCSSITDASAVEISTVEENSCLEMFRDCTSLVNGPKLTFDTLAHYACSLMFKNCSSLMSLQCTTTADVQNANCFKYWMEDVYTEGGVFKGAQDLDPYGSSSPKWPIGDNGVPAGWIYLFKMTDVPADYVTLTY